MVAIVVYNYNSHYYRHAHKTAHFSLCALISPLPVQGTEKAMLPLTPEQIISNCGPTYLAFLEKLALSHEVKIYLSLVQ